MKNLYNNASFGINKIKLRDLLTIKESTKHDEIIRTLMPPLEIGSITLVDQIVLLKLLRLIAPRTVIEIGTYLGYTSAILAMNCKANIFTIDLPKSKNEKSEFDLSSVLKNGSYNDDFLRAEQNLKGEVYLEHLENEEKERITLVKADSTSLDFKKSFTKAEFVFIDGGHDKHIIESDTLNARSLIEVGVIVWHDFGSDIHSDVTDFINEQKDRKIFHVNGSLCAFEFINIGEL